MTASFLARQAFILATPLALALMLAASPVSAEPRIGQMAPDFSGVDSSGKTRSLSELRGKTVVLEWTNNECPLVGKHYSTGNMQKLQKEAVAKDVVWLSVISSAPGRQGHVAPKKADQLTASRKASPTAVILDGEGKIGHAYAARTTPHMFVINPKGTLVYKGAIDDKPSANHGDVPIARNYVREALNALTEGKAINPAATRAYGCSVKYGS
jgi:hypothetical protein